MKLEKLHYQQQLVFYSVDKSIIVNLKNELEETRVMYENTLTKYTSKLDKIESEIEKEIENYKIETNEKLNKEIEKEIQSIDINYLKTLVMEKRYD